MNNRLVKSQQLTGPLRVLAVQGNTSALQREHGAVGDRISVAVCKSYEQRSHRLPIKERTAKGRLLVLNEGSARKGVLQLEVRRGGTEESGEDKGRREVHCASESRYSERWSGLRKRPLVA